MPRPKDEDKEKAILDAADAIFSLKGFHNATVDEIAAAAGVSKGTVYIYFEDKMDLLFSLIGSRITKLANDLEELSKDESLNPADLLCAMMDTHLKFTKSNDLLLRQLTPDKIRSDGSVNFDHNVHMKMVREKFLNPIKQIINTVTRCIERGQEMGIFDERINPSSAAVMLTNVVKGLATARIMTPELEIDEDESVESMKIIFLEGLKKR